MIYKVKGVVITWSSCPFSVGSDEKVKNMEAMD